MLTLLVGTLNSLAQDTWTIAGSQELFGTSWDLTDENNDMTSTDGVTYTLTKKDVTLAKGSKYEYKVVKNRSWSNDNYGANGVLGGSNVQLEVDETAKYDVTITFVNDDTHMLSHKVEKKAGEVENAKIESVTFNGSFNDWGSGITLTKGDGDVYTGVLDLSATTIDVQFKLVINGGTWLGYGSGMTIDAPDGWISYQTSGDMNYILVNSKTDYKTYNITATWEANPSAAAGWTLKIAGKDARDAGPMNKYTATFDNAGNWETVYAYTFSKEGETVTAEELGGWPGKAMTKTETGYSIEIEAAAAPQFIIFHNNAGVQTEDLAFEDGKAYNYLKNFTAKFKFPENYTAWDKVYAYTYGPEILGEWPGTEITSTLAEGVYTATFSAVSVPENIIFNCGKGTSAEDPSYPGIDQTENLVFEDGKTYEFVPKQQYTATFKFGEGVTAWDEVHAYAWTEDGNELIEYTGEWPGEKIEAADGVYTLNILAYEAPKSIQFNDGKENGVKTDDLAFENGKAYSYDKKTFTVQYVNTTGWENVKAYAWTGSGNDVVEPLGAFPGEKMGVVDTEYEAVDGQKYPVYELKFDALEAPAKILFNNGETEEGMKKTDDFDFENKKQYVGELTYTWKAQFKFPEGYTPWEKVCAYAYYEAPEGEVGIAELTGGWPGKEMELAEGVYTISFPASIVPSFIIFNNGKNADEGGIQTENLKFEQNKTYEYEIPAEDIAIAPETGANISEVLAAAIAGKKVGNITINLAEGGAYTVNAPIVAPASLYINGNGATIDASGNQGAFIQLSATPDERIKNSNNYYQLDAELSVKDVTVKGVQGRFFYDNGKQYSLKAATIDNAVIALATTSEVPFIAFNTGGIGAVTVKNSTIYQTGESNVKYFAQYNNGARQDRLGWEASFTYENNTFYKVASGNWANGNGMQNYTQYVVKNNIWVDCSTGTIARYLMFGRLGGNGAKATYSKNTYWKDGAAVDQGNYDSSTDEDVPLTTDPNFKDAKNGDFAVDAASDQAKNKTGDTDWGTWNAPKTAMYIVGDFTGGFPGAMVDETEIGWDVAKAMTQDATNPYVWTLTLENQVIEGKKYEYKAVADKTWTDVWQLPAEGNNDWVFGTDEYPAGVYNLTFTVNTQEFTLSVAPEFISTGINAVKREAITNNGEYYNLAGQRVAQPTKGLYIVNGKKVIVK